MTLKPVFCRNDVLCCSGEVKGLSERGLARMIPLLPPPAIGVAASAFMALPKDLERHSDGMVKNTHTKKPKYECVRDGRLPGVLGDGSGVV